MRAGLPALVGRFDMLFAVGLGAVATLGFPPFGWWPAPVLALTGLFLLCADRGWKRAAWLGWLFGFAHFASGIYWVFISTHIYGGAPLALGLALAAVLFGYMAVYPALLAGVASRFGLWKTPAGWIGVPALWLLGELLRGWVYSGFPWLALGYIAMDMPSARLAPLIGVHGLSLLFALSAYSLFRAIDARGVARPLAMIAALLPLAGAVFPTPTDWTADAGAPMTVAIVQGNVPQGQKWNAGVGEEILQRYRALTLAGADQARLVVWPEVVPNRPYDQLTGYFAELATRMRERDAVLLGGVLMRGEDAIYNSMLALGATQGRYDKRHLVPFGEYFPIPDWLRPVMDVLGTPYSDFSPGASRHDPILVDGQRLGISICFEDVFASEFRVEARQAAFLVNATNDAWFARSSAPHQHLQIARFRALETGRWLVRSTNTGISAFIGPDGSVVVRSELYRTELLRGSVVPRRGVTPYARWGDQPLWWISVMGIVVAIVLALRSGRFSRQ